jgi:two-component system OmpR family sensor kinase
MELADAVGSAVARQIDLGFDHADDGVVTAHEDALRILIRNLLDNAIKYTPVGGKIDVGVHRAKGGLALTVEDNGPGIPPEDRLRVLDRFYRVPGAEATGSGLGLAIVSAIADMHGAQLALDTAPALGGLRVTVIFPAAA